MLDLKLLDLLVHLKLEDYLEEKDWMLLSQLLLLGLVQML